MTTIKCVGLKCENNAAYLIDGEHNICCVHFAQLINIRPLPKFKWSALNV